MDAKKIESMEGWINLAWFGSFLPLGFMLFFIKNYPAVVQKRIVVGCFTGLLLVWCVLIGAVIRVAPAEKKGRAKAMGLAFGLGFLALVSAFSFVIFRRP